MKIMLVTGGCGFIGSNFIQYILDKYPDYCIVNLDKLTYAGNLANLMGLRTIRVIALSKAICDAQVVELSAGSDYVVNFAAETHVDRSIMGGQNSACEYQRRIPGSTARVIRCRTLFAGEHRRGLWEYRKGEWTEEWPLEPRSPIRPARPVLSSPCGLSNHP